MAYLAHYAASAISNTLSKLQIFHHPTAFPLENGTSLPELHIAYHTYGKQNEKADNVIWICHALTGNSEAGNWWSGLIGEGKLFDPADYFIVCANMLGSCYGTTSPISIRPETGKSYGNSFPHITVRDMVRSFQLLRKHLGIQKIQLLIGGSMGGQLALEWSIIAPYRFEKLCILASNAQHSAWGIAFNESQRMAIEADPTFGTDAPDAGKNGLKAARAIAMLSYRNYLTYNKTQSDTATKLGDFKASSYQQYQGNKLSQRFDPVSYIRLNQAMDSHNIGRDRNSVEAALKQIKTAALIIGIQSDILFPIVEQQRIAEHIPDAQLELIDSPYGHDGFLIEFEQIAALLKEFLEKGARSRFRTAQMEGIHKRGLPGTEAF